MVYFDQLLGALLCQVLYIPISFLVPLILCIISYHDITQKCISRTKTSKTFRNIKFYLFYLCWGTPYQVDLWLTMHTFFETIRKEKRKEKKSSEIKIMVLRSKNLPLKEDGKKCILFLEITSNALPCEYNLFNFRV